MWAQAVHDRAADTASAALPSALPQLVDAGLVRQSVGPWELAMNVRKGGSLMLFRRGSLASVEARYAAALDEHAWATSQTATAQNPWGSYSWDGQLADSLFWGPTNGGLHGNSFPQAGILVLRHYPMNTGCVHNLLPIEEVIVALT